MGIRINNFHKNYFIKIIYNIKIKYFIMTKSEKNLLDELKEFFTKKYDKEWEPNFKKYTSKLVKDGHINQEIVDEYLDSDEKQLDEIVKRFASFSKKSRSSSSSSSGCGSSPRSYSSGCGGSSRSYSSGCGGGSSSRSSC